MSSYEFWDELGKIFNAVVAYQEKNIEFNKRFISPWIRLGNVFDKQDRNNEAIEAYHKAIEIDPADAQNWFELGNVHFKMDSFDTAAEAFQKAMDLDPNFGWACSNLGMTLVSQGKVEEAIPLFCKGIELLTEDKDKAVVWNRLGNAYRKLNQYDQALEAFHKADELDKDNAGFRDNLDEVAEGPTLVQPAGDGEAAVTEVTVSPIELIVAESQAEEAAAQSAEETKAEASEAVAEAVAEVAAEAPGEAVEPPTATEAVAEPEAEAAVSEEAEPEAVAAPEPAVAVAEPAADAAVNEEAAPEVIEQSAAEAVVEPAAEVAAVTEEASAAAETTAEVSEAPVAAEAAPAHAPVAEEAKTEADAVAEAVEAPAVAEAAPADAPVAEEAKPEVPAVVDQTVTVVAPDSVQTFTETLPVAENATETSDVALAPEITAEATSEPTEAAAEAASEDNAETAATEITVNVTVVQVEQAAEAKEENAEFDGGATQPSPAIRVKAEEATAEQPVTPEVSPVEAAVAEDPGLLELPAHIAYEEFLKDTNEPVEFFDAKGDDKAEAPVSPEPVAKLDESGDLQIEMDTKNAHVWNELGNVYYNSNAIDDAIVAYSKAIELDRWFAWPYSNLALAYVQKHRFVEAILLYQRSIELFADDKDKAISWNRLGNVYRRLNDYENAIASYQRADALDPDNATLSLQSRFSLLGNYAMEQKPTYVS